MTVKITHEYEPSDPGVGRRDDEHSIVVEITARTSDLDSEVDDALHALAGLRDRLLGY